MFAVLALIVAVPLSLLVIQTGTIAPGRTGLSREVARFQAISAFSGAGFTTDEAEQSLRTEFSATQSSPSRPGALIVPGNWESGNQPYRDALHDFSDLTLCALAFKS